VQNHNQESTTPNHIRSIGAHRSLLDMGARMLRRIVWRLRRFWRRGRVAFVYNESYSGVYPGPPVDPRRAERVLAFLTEEDLLGVADVSVARPPSLRNLLRAHTPEYLESLQQPETVAKILGVQVSDEELVGLLEVQRQMVGGTIQATRLAVLTRSPVVNLGGGFHHAHRDRGMAFCAFNDIAVAITRLRAKGYRQPILVVDLDIHDGNGTRSIFAHDPTVFTYSIHNQHWGETAAEASLAIELGDKVSDEVYLGTLLKTLPEVVASHKPELVIYLAGTDPAADDALGNWCITPAGMLARDQFVVQQVRSQLGDVPLVVVLGGGYGSITWQYTARFVSWLISGRAIEPPLNEELTVRSLRRLLARLDRADLTSSPNDAALSFTQEDLIGIVPGLPRRTRYLDYFSPHGVELLLEKLGVFDQIRVRGFSHPVFDLDLNHALGETLRVWADSSRQELLVELRVHRSHRVLPGFEVLILEWLLLQNPRAEFGPYRRPLPGQKHPGLRMLREVFGLLVVICEMLKLDGICYTPSGYHVAAQSRGVVKFLSARHELMFRALEHTLEGLSLAAASQAVQEGRVVDSATRQPFEWTGFPMVHPVSAKLRQRVEGEEYQQQLAQEPPRFELLARNEQAE